MRSKGETKFVALVALVAVVAIVAFVADTAGEFGVLAPSWAPHHPRAR